MDWVNFVPPAALSPRKDNDTHLTESLLGPTVGLKSFGEEKKYFACARNQTPYLPRVALSLYWYNYSTLWITYRRIRTHRHWEMEI
jgi:hypothetical protein